MDIQFNAISSTHGMISVTLYEQDYKVELEKEIKNCAQNVRLKGFRMGAVPIDLVRKMHGRSILKEQLYKAARDALNTHLEQENILVFIEPLLVGYPKESDFNNLKRFTFSYEVGLIEKNPVQLGDHISVTEFDISHVEEKVVDELLEGLQIVHGVATSLDRSAKNSIVYGTFEDNVGNGKLKLRLSLERLPEHLRNPLIGLHRGDKAILSEEIMEYYSSIHLNIGLEDFGLLQKKAIWPGTFIISEIAHVEPALLDPSFFERVLGKNVPKTEQDFRKALGSIVLFDKRKEARSAFIEALRNQLFKYNEINLPDAYLKRWISSHNPNASLQEVEEYYASYMDDLKWEILLNRIIRSNNLAVTQRDVLDEALRMFENTVLNKDVKEGAIDIQNEESNVPLVERDDFSHIKENVISFLKRNNGENFVMLHERLSRERAIAFIKQHISVQHKEVKVDRFDEQYNCSL